MCCNNLKKQVKGKASCFSNSNVASENGKEFRIKKSKSKKVCRIKVDDCLITDAKRLRCDYLFKICGANTFYFVELKGTNVLHAVKQIISTYDYIRKKTKSEIEDKRGIIVSSTIPRCAEQNFRKQQEKALKEKGLLIKKGHKKYIERLD